MMKRNLGLLAMLATLTGCIGGTSVEPDYYSLVTTPGPVVADVHYTVKIQRPLMAGYLDRPEIVRQDGVDVYIDDGKRWAEPLDGMFERVLLQDLQLRLPGATILNEDIGSASEARVTIATDIQQFNRIEDGQVALAASLNMRDKGTHDQPTPQHINYAIEASSSTPQDLSKLIGKLADGIATLMQTQLVEGNKITPKIIKAPPSAE